MAHDQTKFDVEALLQAGEFPFRCEFSLRELARYWEREAEAGHPIGRLIRERLAGAPEVVGPITDRAALDRHRDLVDLMMSAVFPPALREETLGAALVPFQLRSLYATPTMERRGLDESGRLRGRSNMDPRTGLAYRILQAYALVLPKFYGIPLDVEYPLVVTVDDRATGWERYLKTRFDPRFLAVEPIGDVPPLDDEARRRVLASVSDPVALMTLLPPDRFAFRGFTVFTAVDVTDQEILSAIKRELIERESIVSSAPFKRLEERLRAYLRRPGLELGLAAMEGEQIFLLGHGEGLQHGCIFADSKHYQRRQFEGSIFEQAVKRGEPLVVDDLQTWPGRTAIEDALLGHGVRSIVVAPLHYQDEVIGVLELTSDRPGELNPSQAFRLREVLPLFSMAVKRSMDELDTRIQAVIKEKCTAIHPVVEWRFRRAVMNTLEKSPGADGEIDLGPIVFEGVHPLYALTDIRGSSLERARGIQADLLEQLRLAREVVRGGHATRALPALDELGYRIDKHAAKIESGLSAGDELGVIAFLRTSVEPLFDHLAGFGPAVRERVEAYRAAVDPALGFVYRQRRRFEESITRLNDGISAYLDLEQQVAQSMYPHYFEKQKTDGVDHQIYIGASLVEDGRFDPIYLRNLRLWQLMVTCGIAARAERLKTCCTMPLDTTHLILVQHAPLAIRFRFDEKRFDVDGAYNARYEIVKKRIDKASVRNGAERLTQPGRIAVVYGHPAEAAEYHDYVEYLQSLGYLTGGVEDLDLDELQGVRGLRALRVGIDLANPRLERPVTVADLTARG
ncbi:MAG TPA: GAF domain-containing protein [Methylomirabilota bacterium]|nr:GAF domain-containing protein [Methylomirabilota bacterium]